MLQDRPPWDNHIPAAPPKDGRKHPSLRSYFSVPVRVASDPASPRTRRGSDGFDLSMVGTPRPASYSGCTRGDPFRIGRPIVVTGLCRVCGASASAAAPATLAEPTGPRRSDEGARGTRKSSDKSLAPRRGDGTPSARKPSPTRSSNGSSRRGGSATSQAGSYLQVRAEITKFLARGWLTSPQTARRVRRELLALVQKLEEQCPSLTRAPTTADVARSKSKRGSDSSPSKPVAPKEPADVRPKPVEAGEDASAKLGDEGKGRGKSPPPPAMGKGKVKGKGKVRGPAPLPFGRRFNWQPLPQDRLVATIFDGILHHRENDVGRLERIFQQRPPSRFSLKVASKRANLVQLFDAKRAEQILIITSKWKASAEVLAAFSALDFGAAALDIDFCEGILAALPTPEESAKLLEYSDRAEVLAPAEVELLPFAKMCCPSACHRVRLVIFAQTMDGVATRIRAEAATLREACAAVRNSRALRAVIQWILCLGNMLNHRATLSNRHVAGFSLDCLSQLALCKSTNGSPLTLLHVLLAELVLEDPALPALLASEMQLTSTAARITLRELHEGFAWYSSEIAHARTCLEEVLAKAKRREEDETREIERRNEEDADQKSRQEAALGPEEQRPVDQEKHQLGEGSGENEEGQGEECTEAVNTDGEGKGPGEPRCDVEERERGRDEALKEEADQREERRERREGDGAVGAAQGEEERGRRETIFEGKGCGFSSAEVEAEDPGSQDRGGAGEETVTRQAASDPDGAREVDGACSDPTATAMDGDGGQAASGGDAASSATASNLELLVERAGAELAALEADLTATGAEAAALVVFFAEPVALGPEEAEVKVQELLTILSEFLCTFQQCFEQTARNPELTAALACSKGERDVRKHFELALLAKRKQATSSSRSPKSQKCSMPVEPQPEESSTPAPDEEDMLADFSAGVTEATSASRSPKSQECTVPVELPPEKASIPAPDEEEMLANIPAGVTEATSASRSPKPQECTIPVELPTWECSIPAPDEEEMLADIPAGVPEATSAPRTPTSQECTIPVELPPEECSTPEPDKEGMLADLPMGVPEAMSRAPSPSCGEEATSASRTPTSQECTIPVELPPEEGSVPAPDKEEMLADLPMGVPEAMSRAPSPSGGEEATSASRTPTSQKCSLPVELPPEESSIPAPDEVEMLAEFPAGFTEAASASGAGKSQDELVPEERSCSTPDKEDMPTELHLGVPEAASAPRTPESQRRHLPDELAREERGISTPDKREMPLAWPLGAAEAACA